MPLELHAQVLAELSPLLSDRALHDSSGSGVLDLMALLADICDRSQLTGLNSMATSLTGGVEPMSTSDASSLIGASFLQVDQISSLIELLAPFRGGFALANKNQSTKCGSTSADVAGEESETTGLTSFSEILRCNAIRATMGLLGNPSLNHEPCLRTLGPTIFRLLNEVVFH
jgi:hypothetical protein